MKTTKTLARRWLAASAQVGALLLLAACATVTRSEHASWSVNSAPQGAEVRTSSGDECPTTPCSILVRRNEPFSATLTLQGYRPETVRVTPTVSPEGGLAFLGNAVIGGVLGAGIDLYTGAALDPSPNGKTIVLTSVGALADKAPSAGYRWTASAGVPAVEGCTSEKRLYAVRVGVPCEALGRRVDLRTFGLPGAN